MKKILLLLALALTGSFASAQDATAIINRYYQITGLDKIDPAKTSAMVEMDMTANEQAIAMSCALKLPSKVRIDMTMAGQSINIVINGDKGSVSGPGMPTQQVPAEQLAQFRKQVDILSSLKWDVEDYDITLKEPVKEGEKTYDVVEMIPKNKEVPIQAQTLWFDRKTGLADRTIATVTTPQGTMEVSTICKDYMKSGILTYPSVIEGQAGGIATKIHIKKYEFGVQIPDTLFIVAQ